MTIELPSALFKASPFRGGGAARHLSPIRCDGLSPRRFVACLASRSSTPDCQAESGWFIGQSFFCITYNNIVVYLM